MRPGNHQLICAVRDRGRIAGPAAGALLVALTTVSAAVQAEPRFEIFGFAQLDYIQDFKRVAPDWEDTLRPSRIPTIDGLYGSDGQASVNVKESRLGVQAWLPVEGSDLYTKVDFDFFGVGNDAGQTTIRLRNAYGQWGQFLAGQTNSLFMDIDIFPNVIDYWGPTGMVFLRNPQIRWTPVSGDNSFAIAIEKPSNDIDSGQFRELDPGFADNLQNDEKVPDFTAQFNSKHEWGHFQIAGILRDIGFDSPGTPGNDPSDSVLGWGVDLTGSIKFGESNSLKLGVVYGDGIASYMNDGGVDLAPDGTVDNPDAKAVPLLGVLAYLDHAWSEQWTSAIGYSQTKVDNQSLQEGDAYESGQYASVNLLYTPVKNIMTGAEALWGERTDNNGDSGTDVRMQFSVKYSFSSNDFKAN